jgi:hypothetical protein
VFQSSKGCQSAKVEILFAERTVLLALVIRSAPGPETYSRWWRIQLLERAAPVALNGIKPVVVIVFISVLSPILPLAAAVTALTLGALPAQAASLSPGKRDEVKVVAFPLLALRGQAPASIGSHVSHVSHSSHVSGIGGHNSHVSHVSHVSSVPAPSPTSAAPVTSQPPPPAVSPAPVGSSGSVGSPAAAPQGSPAVVGSGSPTSTTSNGSGCAFFIVAPFGALMSGIRRLVRRGKAR